jgi:hypothetical protein
VACGRHDEQRIGAPGADPRRAPDLYRAAPILGLKLVDAAGKLDALCASPVLDRIVWLDLFRQRIGDAGAQAIASSPHLRQLAWLHLGYAGITRAGIEALVASPNLPSLRYVNLVSNPGGNPAIRSAVRRAIDPSRSSRAGEATPRAFHRAATLPHVPQASPRRPIHARTRYRSPSPTRKAVRRKPGCTAPCRRQQKKQRPTTNNPLSNAS